MVVSDFGCGGYRTRQALAKLADDNLGHLGGGNAARWIATHRLQRLRDPARRDRVDPHGQRRLGRRRAHERLHGGVDGGDDRAARRRKLRGKSRRERDRPAGPDRLRSVADDIDLAQQFVGERKRPILIGQLVPRLVARRSARADDSIKLADAFEQRGERFRIRDVDAFGRTARRADALALAQRLHDLFSDEPGGSNDDYLAHTAPLLPSLPESCGMEPRLQVEASLLSPRAASNPALDAPAIIGIVRAEGCAKARLLERDDRPVHRRPGEDHQDQRPGSPEREREADVDDGQGQIHRVARPCVRAAGDEARRAPGRVERRAPEHEPSGRGRGERTACDRKREAGPAHGPDRHPRRPPRAEPIESGPGQKHDRELNRRRDDRQDGSVAPAHDADLLPSVRTTRPRTRPARRSSSACWAMSAGLVSIGGGFTLPARASAMSSLNSGRVPVSTPTTPTPLNGKVASGMTIEPPNRPTTNRRPPRRKTDRPNAALVSAPTKSIAETPPPVSAMSLLRASGSAGSITAEAPASSAACRFAASMSATIGAAP